MNLLLDALSIWAQTGHVAKELQMSADTRKQVREFFYGSYLIIIPEIPFDYGEESLPKRLYTIPITSNSLIPSGYILIVGTHSSQYMLFKFEGHQ